MASGVRLQATWTLADVHEFAQAYDKHGVRVKLMQTYSQSAIA
jgi:hypothetical protein